MPEPSRLLSLLVGAAALAQGPAPATPAGKAPRIAYDLQYSEVSRDPKRNRLDLWLPADVTNPPLVMFIHGGSWMGGSKDDLPGVALRLVGHGFAAAMINYRLNPGARWPAFAEDGAAAFAWLRTHAAEYGFDRERMFVMGHSAGAQIAAAVAGDPRWLAAHDLRPDHVRGLVAMSGIFDLRPRHPLLQGIFGQKTTQRADASPILFVTPRTPPTLLVWGEHDMPGLPMSAQMMRRRLEQLGVPVTTMPLTGANHVDYVFDFERPERDRASPRIAEFIRSCATPSTTPKASPPRLMQTVTEVRLGEGAHQRLRLHRPVASKPMPWVLFARDTADAEPLAIAWCKLGIATAILDIGLRPALAHPLGAQTVTDAFAHLYQHGKDLGLDPARGHLVGHGDAGLLTNLVALDSRWLTDAGLPANAIRAVASLSAPIDVQPAGAFPGVFPSEHAARVAASPITWPRQNGPPLLLLWAERDLAGRAHDQLRMVMRAETTGQAHVALELPGHDHSSYLTSAGTDTDAISWLIAGFFGL
ncbi:MAG: alpha/beta hydrolase fold domain-containing protein [Planctomycetes bacterium]|nr:alpha/beta hydrolase fold domain-containing protein [Planctomycetota bacterium]